MKYDFVKNRKKLFNSLFYKLRKTKEKFVVSYGGSGSGKSVASHQIELLEHLKSTCNYDTLFIRKHGTDIYDSCYKLLESLAKQYSCYHEFNWTFSNSKRQIENKTTGSRMVFKGIDDAEKLKSIVGIKRIVVEEANQLNHEDFLEIVRRARGIKDIQIVLLLNPVSKNHWIKTELIEGEAYKGRVKVFHTTYNDNKFLLEEDRKELENLKHVSQYHYDVYALGKWGVEDPEKLFAKDYDENKHFGKSLKELYDPGLDIFLSWDFNIQNTCLVIQNPDEDTINVLKEYHIKGYDLFMLADLIQADFPNHFNFFNGDASGNAGSALTRGNESAYEILRACFDAVWEQFRVPAANPSHLNSRLLTNVILKFANVNISEECPELNNDMQSVEVDDRGSMEAYKKKNPERTHFLDPLRYHFNYEHQDKLKKYGMGRFAA